MSIKQEHYDKYVSSGQYVSGGQAVDVSIINNADRFFAPRRPYLQRMIRLHVQRDLSQNILDLGCGHGALLFFLKQFGYTNVSGVDVSQEQVALAHQLGIKEVELGGIDEFIEDKNNLGTVFLMDVLEHLHLEDTDRLLKRLRERMSPTGRLVIHVPNGEGIFGQRIRYGDLTHETCFTPKSVRQLLGSIGFRRIECFENKPIPHGIKSIFRRIIWNIGSSFHRVLLAAETGETEFVLSQNMLVVADA